MTRRRVAVVVGVLLVVLAVGAAVAWSRRDDLATTALVRAAEGTWSCESADWEVLVDSRVTVEIDRSGLYRLTYTGDQGDAQESTGVWTLRDGRLDISTFGGVSSWAEVPDELVDTELEGGWDRVGETADGFDVSVGSPTEVTFTQSSTGNELSCDKGSSRRPDIPVGVDG